MVAFVCFFFLRFGAHFCCLIWKKSSFIVKIIISYFRLSLQFFVKILVDFVFGFV